LEPGRGFRSAPIPEEFGDETKRLRYYLAGSYFSDEAHAQYVLSRNRDWRETSLTPLNEVVFLFQKSSDNRSRRPRW
jgi:hypothetical protein